MGVFERYIPCVMYAKGKDLYELYFTIFNKPGKLMEALKVFAKYNINLLSISAYALPEWVRAPVFLFADFSNADGSIDDLMRELERITESKVYAKKSSVGDFMSSELSFPLLVIPGIRSIIILELDLKEMLRGLYDNLGESAAVFLFYLAYPGGKFFAKYLSEKFGLKGRELLLEVLKIYQACGWARIELLKYEPENMRIILRLYDSVECKVFEKADKPMSQLIRGHISGFLTGLLKMNVRAIETKCIAKGDPYCEFYIEKV